MCIRDRYQYLVLTGKLTEHLNQIDKEVREKVEMLAEQWGVTEELKMQDQMEWVRRMNNIKNVVEESAMKIIYL